MGHRPVCVYIWVREGSRLGQKVLYSWLADSVFLPHCLAAAKSHPLQPTSHTKTHTDSRDFYGSYLDMFVHIYCMYTCIHWYVYTFVYLCVLISINAHGCVFMCAFLFWERVWNISAQIRECCGDHCCVFQNHDYFLSCLRRKSKLHPLSFSKGTVCARMHLCVRLCTLVHGMHGHLCCFSVYKEKHTLCCLLFIVQGFPSFTCDYGKSHSLLHQ